MDTNNGHSYVLNFVFTMMWLSWLRWAVLGILMKRRLKHTSITIYVYLDKAPSQGLKCNKHQLRIGLLWLVGNPDRTFEFVG